MTGVLIEGEYEVFYEMVESIYWMIGLEEDYNDYYGVSEPMQDLFQALILTEAEKMETADLIFEIRL